MHVQPAHIIVPLAKERAMIVNFNIVMSKRQCELHLLNQFLQQKMQRPESLIWIWRKHRFTFVILFSALHPLADLLVTKNL